MWKHVCKVSELKMVMQRPLSELTWNDPVIFLVTLKLHLIIYHGLTITFATL